MEDFLRDHGFEESDEYDDVLECQFESGDPVLEGIGIELDDGDYATIQFNTTTGELSIFWDGGLGDVDPDELMEALS